MLSLRWFRFSAPTVKGSFGELRKGCQSDRLHGRENRPESNRYNSSQRQMQILPSDHQINGVLGIVEPAGLGVAIFTNSDFYLMIEGCFYHHAARSVSYPNMTSAASGRDITSLKRTYPNQLPTRRSPLPICALPPVAFGAPPTPRSRHPQGLPGIQPVAFALPAVQYRR